MFIACLLKDSDPLFYLGLGPTAQYMALVVLVAKRNTKGECSFRRRIDIDVTILQDDDTSRLSSVNVAQIIDIEIKE